MLPVPLTTRVVGVSAIFQQLSFRSPRTRIRGLDILFSMPLPLTERIKELRREISEINRQNGEFWLSGKRDSFKLADQQRGPRDCKK